MKRILLLTGAPGIGKTTVLMKAAEVLKAKGFRVGGMITQEVRKSDVRVGFEIVDLSSSKRGWLAQVGFKKGPRVGKYNVDLASLDDIGAESIDQALRNSDVVVIDEIGPMELFSDKFKSCVEKALKSQKLVLAVVHWKIAEEFVDNIRTQKNAELIVVTCENRDRIPEILGGIAQDCLRQN